MNQSMSMKSAHPLTWLIILIICISSVALANAHNDQASDVNEVERSTQIVLNPTEQAWLKKHKNIQIRIFDYPPYMIPHEDSAPTGIIIDYFKLITERTGVDFKFYSSDKTFSQALADLTQHQGENILPVLVPTPEREKSVLFTNEYLNSPYMVFTRADDKQIIIQLNDLIGKKIALLRGAMIKEVIAKEYPALDIILYDSDIEAIEAVASGKADAYIGNMMLTSYLILNRGPFNLKIAAPTPFDAQHFSMGLRSDWPELAGILNKGLATITPEEKNKIRGNYIALRYENVESTVIVKWVLMVLAAASCIIFLFFFLNRSLKKQVATRTNELQTSKERYDLAMRFVNDGLYDWNIETNEIYYSDGWKLMLGYKPEEIKDEFSVWNQLTHPDDIKASWLMLNEVIEGKRSLFEIEFRMKHKNGNWIEILSRANVALNDAGKAVRVVGTHIDITERKQYEKKLKLLNSAIDNSLNGFDIVNSEGKFIYANKAFAKMYGYERADEIVGISPVSFCVDPHLPEKIIQELHDNGEYDFEYEAKKRDGSIFFVHMFARLAYDDQGNEIYPTSCIDITESKRAQREKEHLQRQLQQAQKMEAVGTLAGGIAHDFNNILSAVLGFTELALDAIEKDTHIQDDLQEVYTAGLRAKELVQQILTFARQSDEELKPIQINHIVKEVMKFIRSSIPTTIEIKHNIESDSYIMGDTTQIHQIMMNLCTNAAHAMETKGGLLEVTLKDITIDQLNVTEKSQLKPGNYIELKVSDTGDGIDPQIIDKIFNPYFTTKKLGEGTGMGLAMVHGIVDTYNGTICVASHLGVGTIFTINLPIARESNTQQQYKKENLPRGNERILFVDDEAQITKVASRILSQLGYCVTTKTCSVEALELFTSNPDDFDLVISDVTMPKITGDKLTQKLLKIRPDIPVILCTGYTKKLSAEKASEIGVKAFAYKPIVKEDLAKTVRTVLDLHNCVE